VGLRRPAQRRGSFGGLAPSGPEDHAMTIIARIEAAGLELTPTAFGTVAITVQRRCAHSAEVQLHPCAGRTYPNERAAKAAFVAAGGAK